MSQRKHWQAVLLAACFSAAAAQEPSNESTQSSDTRPAATQPARKIDLSATSRPTATRPYRAPTTRPAPNQPATRPVTENTLRSQGLEPSPATTRPAAIREQTPAVPGQNGSTRATANPRVGSSDKTGLSSPSATTSSKPSIMTLKPKPGEAPPQPPLISLPPLDGLAPLKALVPQFNPVMLTWIAVFVILALTFQSKPIFTWHNADGLVLALTAVGLALRSEPAQVPAGGPTLQCWSYGLLTCSLVYWLIRGIFICYARTLPALTPNVREGAMSIFVIAGLVLAFSAILRTPLSESARDGLAGGAFLLETQKLPYGDLPGRDSHSPLLYGANAGAIKLTQWIGASDAKTWSNRSLWLSPESMPRFDSAAVRLLCGVLFLLLFGAVAWLGQRLHSAALGQSMVVILGVFPGALECLAQPDLLLPTTLLAWALVFLTLPFVGPFLATVAVVAAGLAWPWAWLTIPLLLGSFVRRGWQGLIVVLALFGSFAGVGYGLYRLVEPTLPRADGALAAAGDEPGYTVALSAGGELTIDSYKSQSLPKSDFKSWVWDTLLRAESTTVGHEFTPGTGIDRSVVFFRELFVPAAARDRVQEAYRDATVNLPLMPRLATCLRSVLECTWRPESVAAAIEPTPWRLWIGGGSENASQRVFAQRMVKFLLGVLALLLAFRLFRVQPIERHHLFGALLAVIAGTMLASEGGAAANWLWLMPSALAALALRCDREIVEPLPTTGKPAPLYPGRPSTSGMYIRRSPEPRISVER